jgi:hypothetical protein
VAAAVRQRHVADAVTAAHRGAPLPKASIAELADGAHAHPQTELTAEASEKPDLADAAQRFDVLRLATGWARRNRTTECSDSILTHEGLHG